MYFGLCFCNVQFLLKKKKDSNVQSLCWGGSERVRLNFWKCSINVLFSECLTLWNCSSYKYTLKIDLHVLYILSIWVKCQFLNLFVIDVVLHTLMFLRVYWERETKTSSEKLPWMSSIIYFSWSCQTGTFLDISGCFWFEFSAID